MTLLVESKRPGTRWLTLIIGVLVLLAGAAAVVLATTVNDSGTANVQVDDKNHSSGLVGLNYASVEYIGSSAQNQSSGTGIFDPFVRLQGAPTEKGYNTNGAVAFDTKAGSWTHAILASAIPVVDCDGDGSGTARCWELFVDINESNTAKYVELTDVEIWFTTNPNLVGYVDPTGFPSGASKVYDFNGHILIHDVNQGSGRGDLRYLVPLTSIDSFTSTTYFVLYSKWGTPTAAPDGKTYGSEGGFEEWKVRKSPNVGIVKTANPAGPVAAGDNIGFDITISNTGPADATNVTITDLLPAGAGNDLNWSLSPAFTGCSITGSAGSQTLNCSFATLAAGTSKGPIHITSDTTDADCAVVSNTATVASGNDGGGQSTDSVTVQCGALIILKQSTKTGNPSVSTAGAEFCYSDSTGCTTTNVTDNGTGDADSTVGTVCVDGLTPGTYYVNETSPPDGYGAASASDVSVTVVNGTNCSTSLPATGATATFTNPPLGEIEVIFRDLGSGETSSSIVCKQGTDTVAAEAEDGDADPAFDDLDETFTDLPPGTYDCQVVIDP